MTLDGFIELLGSATPSPGGGAASAVAASCGAALVAMVASLSEDRPKYAAYAASHARARSRGAGAGGTPADPRRRGCRRLRGLRRGPQAAPRDGRGEGRPNGGHPRVGPRGRRRARCAPSRPAAAVVVASEALAGRSNLNAASDLAVASRLVEASAHGAAENVLVNLPSLGDEALADEMLGRVETLLAEIEDLAEATRAHVERRELRTPSPTAGARRPAPNAGSAS